MKEHDRKPKVGVVLGAGAARGWAHIGVIEALEELEVPIDIICGCSSGAIVAASYATGRFEALAKLARSLTMLKVASYFDFSFDGGGLIEGRQVLRFFEDNLQDVAIEAADVRFGAVATDLHSGREAWFTSGSIIDAVRASIALPGLLTPMMSDGRWLVDGTLVNPLPTSLARALGADVTIAVNLSGNLSGARAEPGRRQTSQTDADEHSSWLSHLRQLLPTPRSEASASGAGKGKSEDRPPYIEVVAGAFLVMNNLITRVRLATDPTDLLLSPDVDPIGLLDFHKAAPAIEAGRAAVEQNKEKILGLLEIGR